MTIKASGRSALILMTGLFVFFAQPSQAEPGDNTATASSKSEKAAGAPVALNKFAKPRHAKKSAPQKSGKAALKSSNASKKAAEVADDSGDGSTAIPPSIANANAQLGSAEAPADSARAMSAKANTMLLVTADKPADAPPAAETEVLAPDQLNELDRAMQQGKPGAPTLTLASAEAPPAPAAPIVASSKEDSAWDQTSLIGKIFIAFGALLTMASAARMFMA